MTDESKTESAPDTAGSIAPPPPTDARSLASALEAAENLLQAVAALEAARARHADALARWNAAASADAIKSAYARAVGGP